MDLKRIRRLGGPNENFPDKAVYLYGSVERLTHLMSKDQWNRYLQGLREETVEAGMTVEIFRGHVYITWQEKP